MPLQTRLTTALRDRASDSARPYGPCGGWQTRRCGQPCRWARPHRWRLRQCRLAGAGVRHSRQRQGRLRLHHLELSREARTAAFPCSRPRAAAEDALGRYINGFYNPVRRHSTLGLCQSASVRKAGPIATKPLSTKPKQIQHWCATIISSIVLLIRNVPLEFLKPNTGVGVRRSTPIATRRKRAARGHFRSIRQRRALELIGEKSLQK